MNTIITAPLLNNNPILDVIATNRRPLLSFTNGAGGIGKRTYTIQIDTNGDFAGKELIEYKNVPEETEFVTGKLVEEKDKLSDQLQYYWRVKTVDTKGNESDWSTSRFFLDTKSDDEFMNLTRAKVKDISASSGHNVKNIIDQDDPGLVSFWQSTPPGNSTQWVKFDMGKVTEISRIWMLSSPSGPDNWLKEFVWQSSDDGESWKDIPETKIDFNDTYRNILNFKPIKARWFRLFISDWFGYAPQINDVILYSPGKPPIPKCPDQDYVLVVGNQHSGFTFSELANFIESLDLKLKTLTVPRWEVSMDMLKKLKRKPIAIVLSGNNADYPNLPMFEFNGEFEIIRETDIPVLGICCGHQMLVAAYGYTYIRSMGWSDISSIDIEEHTPLTQITIDKKDPVFENIPDKYTAPEIHGWAVGYLPKEYKTIASSSYIQAIKSPSKSKIRYGEQFHAEIKSNYNLGTPYLENFLKIALKNA